MTDQRKDEMPDAETQARWILKDVVGLTWDDSIKSIHMTPRSFTLCIQAAISRNCADLAPTSQWRDIEVLDTPQYKKAVHLANYVHCSPHEWPEGKEVALVCQALLDANEFIHSPKLPFWITADDIDNAIKAFRKYDTKKLSLHNWRTMLECMKAMRPMMLPSPPTKDLAAAEKEKT